MYTATDSVGGGKPYWRPTQAPPAAAIGTAPASGAPAIKWVRADWAQNLTANFADVDGTGSKPLWQAMAYYFTPGKSELFPFDNAAIAAYQGQLRQNPGY